MGQLHGRDESRTFFRSAFSLATYILRRASAQLHSVYGCSREYIHTYLLLSQVTAQRSETYFSIDSHSSEPIFQ